MKSVRNTTELIHVRQATEVDLPSLVALPFSAGLPAKHRDRYERQRRGAAVYALAIVEDEIIGHLLLKWDCPSDPHVRALVPPCAEVEDFVVAPHLRGQGVGSEMLTYAGARSQTCGVPRLGIAVGVGNSSARSLYERRGFVLVPGSEHRVSWLAPGEAGRQVREHEDCVYLVKELA